MPSGNTPVTQVTNEDFLRAIFRENWPFAHVTAFPDDPSAIMPAARAKCWGGGQYQNLKDRIRGVLNEYFCVSIFSLADGRAVRRKDNFLAMYCLVADDVKDRIPEEQIRKLPPPSWVLETSPGNEQWGWILTEPETDRRRAENISDGLIRAGLAPDGKDPGMRGVTRYVRLPEGWNLKAKYGDPFKCRMLEWNPERTTTLDALAAPFGVDLDAPIKEYEASERTTWPDDSPVMEWVNDGNLIEQKDEGKFLVRCPRVEEHTDGDDSGTVLYTNEDGGGGFECHHSHGEGKGFNDFLEWAGIKERHDVWRAFRGLKPEARKEEGPGLPTPVPQDQEPAREPGGLGGGAIDFMGGGPGDYCGSGSGDNDDAGGGLGSGGDGPERGTPITSTAPWDLAIGALPDNPGPEDLRGIVNAVAGLPDLERGLAAEALKDKLAGVIQKRDLDKAIKSAMAEMKKRDPDTLLANESMLKGIVFLENEDRYYRLSDGASMKRQAMDSSYGDTEFWGVGATGEPVRITASQAFDRMEGKMVAQELGWRPVPKDQKVRTPIIMLGGARIVNTYRPPTLPEIEGDVTMWLWLGEQLYGPKYWKILVEFYAWVLQHPDKKIRYGVLTIGEPRIGKSAALHPIKIILEDSAKTIGNQEFTTGWGDIWYQTKLLIIEEILQQGEHTVYNEIKGRMVNTGIEVLNIKGRPTVKQDNLTQVCMFSNHWEALHFDKDDDKLFVLEATGPEFGDMNPEDWFLEYHDWVDNQGGASAVYHYLMHLDLSGFKHNVLPERTPAYYRVCEEGKADYQRYITEMINGDQYPFNVNAVELKTVKAAIRDAGYNRGGDRGIVQSLRENGFKDYRGQKWVSGRNDKSPKFWTREDLSGLKAAEVYDWYHRVGIKPRG